LTKLYLCQHLVCIASTLYVSINSSTHNSLTHIAQGYLINTAGCLTANCCALKDT